MEENMQKNEKKGIKVETIVIVILAICLLGTCGFIVYDKFIREDTTVQENGGSESDEDNDDEIIVTADLESKMTDLSSLEKYLAAVGFHNINNGTIYYDEAEERMRYITYLLYKIDNNYSYTQDGQMQESAYLSYDVYKAKYQSVFGDLYSVDDDMVVESMYAHKDHCSSYPSIANGNYVCWNATLFGASGGSTVKLTINQKLLEGNIYKVIGTVEQSDLSVVLESNGTFEIKYVISNGNAYLSSVSFGK